MSDENLDTRLSVHEAVCAQRYEGIKSSFEEQGKRMTRIEYLLYAVMAVVLLGPGVIPAIIKKLVGI